MKRLLSLFAVVMLVAAPSCWRGYGDDCAADSCEPCESSCEVSSCYEDSCDYGSCGRESKPRHVKKSGKTYASKSSRSAAK